MLGYSGEQDSILDFVELASSSKWQTTSNEWGTGMRMVMWEKPC